ncbi:hypothetical protein [Niastella sp. OAS944]|nr:hypothetical protein [Chitinophagaceae bacterium OAS944]
MYKTQVNVPANWQNKEIGSAPWMYPELKGYFADIVWIELNTLEGRFTIA